MDQVVMYLHVFADPDVRLEVRGVDGSGGNVLTRLPRS